MPVTKIRSRWEDGKLIFEDLSGNQVFAIDAAAVEFDSSTVKPVRVAKVALAASDAAAGLFSWQNTTGAAVIVTRLVVDVTTKTTGAATADIGQAATAILSDNLLDGLDINAATGVFDNIDNQGTNGNSTARVADDAFVTGSIASGASAGIVGNVYIHYIEV